MSVRIGKEGRLVLPKSLRDKYKMEEGSRLILREYKGQIILVPVSRYNRPTESLFGAVKPRRPVDYPKQQAREYLRRKLLEELS